MMRPSVVIYVSRFVGVFSFFGFLRKVRLREKKDKKKEKKKRLISVLHKGHKIMTDERIS